MVCWYVDIFLIDTKDGLDMTSLIASNDSKSVIELNQVSCYEVLEKLHALKIDFEFETDSFTHWQGASSHLSLPHGYSFEGDKQEIETALFRIIGSDLFPAFFLPWTDDVSIKNEGDTEHVSFIFKQYAFGMHCGGGELPIQTRLFELSSELSGTFPEDFIDALEITFELVINSQKMEKLKLELRFDADLVDGSVVKQYQALVGEAEQSIKRLFTGFANDYIEEIKAWGVENDRLEFSAEGSLCLQMDTLLSFSCQEVLPAEFLKDHLPNDKFDIRLVYDPSAEN